MKNITLNAGGVVGGLLGAAAAASVVFAVEPEVYQRWVTRLLIGGVTAGAVGGNLLWAWVAGRRASPSAGDAARDRRAAGREWEPDGRSCGICGAALTAPAPGVTLCPTCRGRTG